MAMDELLSLLEQIDKDHYLLCERDSYTYLISRETQTSYTLATYNENEPLVQVQHFNISNVPRFLTSDVSLYMVLASHTVDPYFMPTVSILAQETLSLCDSIDSLPDSEENPKYQEEITMLDE